MDSRRELHGSADEEQQCSAEHDGQRCPEEAVASRLEDLDVRIARDLFVRAAKVRKQKVAASPVRPVCWSGAQRSLRFLRRLNAQAVTLAWGFCNKTSAICVSSICG